ncbi:unnamed protein product [Ambrosiozyma monospora]|uniref:Unnamed protein product n=1 Tax=Ambrosiozyma monospora TaxID=43982 RepID=A0ACB5SSI3_AMBMO|nr:unnamed protein product [Ambrosiozyma monospora]
MIWTNDLVDDSIKSKMKIQCLFSLLLAGLSLALALTPEAVDYTVPDQEYLKDLTTDYDKINDNSLLWGAYRSNLYLGVRPRIPESLMAGLVWFNIDTYQGAGKMRHQCDQGDDLGKFGWVKYSPRYGGREVINDNEFKVNITSDFVKTEDGSWALNIKGKTLRKNVKTSLMFYVGMEGDGDLKYAAPLQETLNLVDGDIKLLGYSSDLGDFDIDITYGNKKQYAKSKKPLFKPELDPSKTRHLSLRVPSGNAWMAKDIFMTFLQENVKNLESQVESLMEIPPEQFSL